MDYKPLLILVAAVFVFSCSKTDEPAEYLKPVKYSKNTPVKFADFDMTYVGERRESIPFHAGKEITIVFHDFRISNEKESKTITWTSGTGDIAPVNFEFNGSKYRLELRILEKEKKKLADDELVITKLQ